MNHPLIEYLELTREYFNDLYKYITCYAKIEKPWDTKCLVSSQIDKEKFAKLDILESMKKMDEINASNTININEAREKLTKLQNKENTRYMIINAENFRNQSINLVKLLETKYKNVKLNEEQVKIIEQLIDSISLLWLECIEELVNLELITAEDINNNTIKLLNLGIISTQRIKDILVDNKEKQLVNINDKYIKLLNDCITYEEFKNRGVT